MTEEEFIEKYYMICPIGWQTIDWVNVKGGDSVNEWLEDNGYSIFTGGDCGCYIKGHQGITGDSYGWGTLYRGFADDEDYDIFDRMFQDGVIAVKRVMVPVKEKYYNYVIDHPYGKCYDIKRFMKDTKDQSLW